MRFFTLAFFVLALAAQAQEYQIRSEFTYCNLNDGKTMQDVITQSAR